MIHLGTVPAGSTVYIPFSTYGKTNGESITCSGLALGDILIYKNGSTTQRASTAGFALLDTDGIDFDGVTGLHGFSLDLSDNTDTSFYAVGSYYWVVVSTITVDSQVITFPAASFRIGAAESATGYPPIDVQRVGGSAASVASTVDANVVTMATDSISAAAVSAAAVTEINAAVSSAISAVAIDLATVASAVEDVHNTLGPFTASGDNTVFGFLRSLLNPSAGVPTDVGGTYTGTKASLVNIAKNIRAIETRLLGACANPQTSAEAFTQTIDGVAVTVTGASITSTGGRGTTTIAEA